MKPQISLEIPQDPQLLNYIQFKTKIEQLEYKFFEKDYPELAFLLRVVGDYYFRESLVRDPQALREIAEKFQKLGEAVAKGHAVVGGIIAGLVATGALTAGIGTIIGLAVGVTASAIEPVKAISMSKNRMDDLGRRIDRFKGSQNLLHQNIYSKGLQLLHTRPKCRALSGGCAKEHIEKAVQVDLFNKCVDALIKIYNDLTFEKFKENENFKRVSEISKKEEIGKAELTDLKIEKPKTPTVFVLILLFIIFALIKR
ncbi:MAG: hypothetical protein NC925_03610 [Candidatus Omnitrophica bacterium]|nr:hypothetical protein [Candidatus Omnitrophota bacterium]